MPRNPCTTKKEGNANRRACCRIALSAAVLLVLGLPSLPLANTVVVIETPDGGENGCPAGKQCGPATTGGQDQNSGKDSAPKESNIFGNYVQGFSDGSVPDDQTRAIISGDSAGEEGASGDQAADNDGKGRGPAVFFGAMAAAVSSSYGKTFANAAEAAGNAILFADTIAPAYLSTSYAANIGAFTTSTGGYAANTGGYATNTNGYAANTDSLAPRQGDAIGAGDTRAVGGGAAQGTSWPSFTPPAFNFGSDFPSSDPGPASASSSASASSQSTGRGYSFTRAQDRGGPAPARDFAPVGATDFGSSPYTGATGGNTEYRGSSARSDLTVSASLPADREPALGNLTVRDFFGEQAEENKSGFMSILMWVGILQALVLGVIVIRVLMDRGR